MAKYKFTEKKVKMPEYDCDVQLVFPSGRVVIIQARPSNADGDYKGSLDIILPENMAVTNWIGDDMAPAPGMKRQDHVRKAKQLVMEIP